MTLEGTALSYPPSIQSSGLIRGPNPWIILATAPNGSEIPLHFIAGDSARMAVGGHIQVTNSPLVHSVCITEAEVTIGTVEPGNADNPNVTHHWGRDGQWAVTGEGTLEGGPGELFDLNTIDLAVIAHIMGHIAPVFGTPVTPDEIAMCFRRFRNLNGSYAEPFVTVRLTQESLRNDPAPRTGARFRTNGELVGVW